MSSPHPGAGPNPDRPPIWSQHASARSQLLRRSGRHQGWTLLANDRDSLETQRRPALRFWYARRGRGISSSCRRWDGCSAQDRSEEATRKLPGDAMPWFLICVRLRRAAECIGIKRSPVHFVDGLITATEVRAQLIESSSP